MKTVFYRSIYLDTELNSLGGGQASRITLPSNEFSVKSTQLMEITLQSLECRRNWYSVNKYNNSFSLFNFPAVGSFTPFTIKPGSYTTFNDLATAIQNAITAVPALAATTCVWTPITRKFEIVLAGALATSYFCTFQVSGGNIPAPAGYDTDMYFSDNTELMGGNPTQNNWDGVTPVNSFVTTDAVDAPAMVGNGSHFSKFVGALNTIETLYLRSGMQNNNFQSLSYEGNTQNPQSAVVSTSIFARIPLSRSHYDDTFEIIQFEDFNNNFSMLIQQQHLAEMTFFLSDHANRPIAEIAKGQSQAGNLSFKMCLKWKIIEQETPQGEYRVRDPIQTQAIRQSQPNRSRN